MEQHSPSPRRPYPARQTLTLDTWQFVRVMVELERATERRAPTAAALYRAWQETWQELDQKLDTLRQQDFAAYAQLMMETQVSLRLSAPQRPALLRTLELLIGRLERDAQYGRDGQRNADLRFESASLRDTLELLGGRVREAETAQQPKRAANGLGKAPRRPSGQRLGDSNASERHSNGRPPRRPSGPRPGDSSAGSGRTPAPSRNPKPYP